MTRNELRAMNQLGRHLADRISLSGPLSIAEYMAAALEVSE